MHKHVQIRLAQGAELIDLAAIEEAASTLFLQTKFALEVDQAPLPLEYLQKQHQLSLIWVAIHHNRHPVGFVVAMPLENAFHLADSASLHLHELSVDPKYSRQGIGTGLTQQVIQDARARAYPHITLSTFRDIPWNAPFYEKLGFREIAQADLGPDLLEIQIQEERSGLPIADRIFMALVLSE